MIIFGRNILRRMLLDSTLPAADSIGAGDKIFALQGGVLKSVDGSLLGGVLRMVTTTVHMNIGTKQALLPAVPTGKKRIYDHANASNASADLSTMSDDVVFSFKADGGTPFVSAFGWGGGGPANSLVYYIAGPNAGVAAPGPIGVEGDVLGLIVFDTSINATVDIDVFYYDVDA